MTPGLCPVCGDAVPARAKACPTCGACERSGWSDEEEDEDAFDYEAFVAEEFGEKPRKPAIGWFWWVAAVVVLAGLVILWVWPR